MKGANRSDFEIEIEYGERFRRQASEKQSVMTGLRVRAGDEYGVGDSETSQLCSIGHYLKDQLSAIDQIIANETVIIEVSGPWYMVFEDYNGDIVTVSGVATLKGAQGKRERVVNQQGRVTKTDVLTETICATQEYIDRLLDINPDHDTDSIVIGTMSEQISRIEAEYPEYIDDGQFPD